VATKTAKRRAKAKLPPRRRTDPRLFEPGLRGSAIEQKLDARLEKRGWWFDTNEADRVCAFFEGMLTHSKGEWAGQNIRLEEWQRERMRRLFGWRRPDGTRRYRRAHFWIPKKNGKSLVAAGIALWLMAFDGEIGAEVYSAAGNEQQARLVFDEARKMVAASPDLREHIETFKRSISHPHSGSRYEVLSAKPGTKHGFNVHGLVIDEVHEFKSRDLYDFLASGTGARRQPLEVVISTAGADVGSFGYELWELAVKLRDGILEDAECMVTIFAAEADDDWRSEATWRKANPNLGISPKLDFLKGELVKATNQPSLVPSFKRLYLNIWTQAARAWLDLAAWRRCPRCPASLLRYRGRSCWGGLDLSKTKDLSALVLVFDREDGLFDALPFFWHPEDHIDERSRADMVSYRLWVDQGYIRATPGNIVDYRAIRADIKVLHRWLNLREIAYDRWSATELVQDLQDEDGVTMVEFGQGYASMNTPACELERRTLGGLIAHPENPVLTWQASNVVVRRDPAGNIKPDKEKSRKRIDGIVALVMALGRATVGANERSVYETRGIRTL